MHVHTGSLITSVLLLLWTCALLLLLHMDFIDFSCSVLFNYFRNWGLSINRSLVLQSPRLQLLMYELLRLYMYKRRVPTGCSLTPLNGVLIHVLWPCNRGPVLPLGDSKQCYYGEVTLRQPVLYDAFSRGYDDSLPPKPIIIGRLLPCGCMKRELMCQ